MPTEIVVAPDECRLAGHGEILVARHISSDWAIAIHGVDTPVGALARFHGEPDAVIRQLLFIRQPLAGCGRTWHAYLVGGAIAPGDEQTARLARSLRLAIQAGLWREGVLLKGEDLGGQRDRSVYFDPASGRLIVRSAGKLAPHLQRTALPCPLAS
jgi:CheD chemotactic sensory transduction